jgi:hypothetical protein
LLHHADAQDRSADADADEPLELVIELERLALEGIEWVLLGIPAQPNAATQIIDFGEVLHPELVDAAQDHGAQDARPDLWAKFCRLLVERLQCCNLNRINQDRIFNNVLEAFGRLNAGTL